MVKPEVVLVLLLKYAYAGLGGAPTGVASPPAMSASFASRPTDGEVCDLRYPVVILDGGLPAPRGAGAHGDITDAVFTSAALRRPVSLCAVGYDRPFSAEGAS